MITAFNKSGDRCFGSKVSKKDGPFYCIGCNCEVILRKGKIRIHHFYHKNTEIYCEYNNESIKHLEAKENLYNKLKHFFPNTEIEQKKYNFIPDIYVPELNTAFEIQRTNLTKQVFKERTQKYINNNIKVKWIFLLDDLNLDAFVVKLKQMHIEALNFYNKYIYVYDKNWEYIQKWKLSDIYSSSSEFYDSSGDYQSFSGKKLKTKKNIILRNNYIDFDSLRNFKKEKIILKKLSFKQINNNKYRFQENNTFFYIEYLTNNRNIYATSLNGYIKSYNHLYIYNVFEKLKLKKANKQDLLYILSFLKTKKLFRFYDFVIQFSNLSVNDIEKLIIYFLEIKSIYCFENIFTKEEIYSTSKKLNKSFDTYFRYIKNKK